jgi:hypothetical protein
MVRDGRFLGDTPDNAYVESPAGEQSPRLLRLGFDDHATYFETDRPTRSPKPPKAEVAPVVATVFDTVLL